MNRLHNDELKLQIVKKELFEGVEIECYEDENENFRITRKQISDVLGYSDVTAFNKVIQRNKDVIGDSVQVKLSSTDNKEYLTETYTFKQLFQILRFTKRPLANAFMNWASLTLEQLIMNKAKLKFNKSEDAFSYKAEMNVIKQELISEMNGIKEENKELKGYVLELKDSFVFKQYTNPKHAFEASLTKYAIHNDLNGSQRYYNFYRDFENWLGIKLPKQKKFTTKEYIISEIGVEHMEYFIDGILNGRIIKSKADNFIDQNGIFSNPIEWDKVKAEFNNCCAYCGEEGVLVEEHLVPQSKPQTTDEIRNIVPACQRCNKEKDTKSIKEWYIPSEYYSDERFNKIKRHWLKYDLNNIN